MLWTLLLYQFLLPIAFLREWCCIFSLLLFRYFSSWKKSLFSTANLYTTTHTLDHIHTPEPGELYLFSGRTESFHLENCNCEKRAEHEGNERRNGEEIIEKRIPQQGFQFSIIVLNIMHDTLMLEGRNPVGMLALNAIQRESLHGSFFVNFVI